MFSLENTNLYGTPPWFIGFVPEKVWRKLNMLLFFGRPYKVVFVVVVINFNLWIHSDNLCPHRPAIPQHRNSPTLQVFEIPPFRKRQKNSTPDNSSASVSHHAAVNQNTWNLVEIPAFKNLHQHHHPQQPAPQQSQPSILTQQHSNHQSSSQQPQQPQQQQPQASVSLLSPADTPWTTDHFKDEHHQTPKKMHAGLENCLRERVVHRSVDDLPIKV